MLACSRKLLIAAVHLCMSCIIAKEEMLGKDDLTPNCDDLLMGQYFCDKPSIDISTQSVANCSLDKATNEHKAKIPCYPAPEVICNGQQLMVDGTTIGFYKSMPCNPTSGKSFKVALLLSIFLGMFGIDRFYLGYPAIGLLKLSTFGFMLVGQLIDIILIAMQVVKPANGGEYIIDYFGPKITHVGINDSLSIL